MPCRYWSVALKGIAIDDEAVSITANMAIMDSGSTAILMSNADAAAVNGVRIAGSCSALQLQAAIPSMGGLCLLARILQPGLAQKVSHSNLTISLQSESIELYGSVHRRPSPTCSCYSSSRCMCSHAAAATPAWIRCQTSLFSLGPGITASVLGPTSSRSGRPP